MAPGLKTSQPRCRPDQRGTDLTLTGRGEQGEDLRGRLSESSRNAQKQACGAQQGTAEVERVDPFHEGLQGLRQGV